MSFEDHSDAFEYVVGTLRGEQRRQFERLLINNDELKKEVSFWEEQLMTLQMSEREVPPNPETWNNIVRRLSELPGSPEKTKTQWWLPNWVWAPGIIATVVLTALLLLLPLQKPSPLNADYVAVLTNDLGEAQLTAVTGADGETLWLQWGEVELPPNGSAQLWAVSKRDGQSRPLAIFEQEKNNQLLLNQTSLRLIRDASHLVLTEEELGGSAIDEPSDIVLAKGVCVRLGDQATNPS